MYTIYHVPIAMPPEELDAYLAKGWYRMGQNIFTCHFLGVELRYYSTIWLRLDLQQHQYSKSQRKRMRQNAKIFHYTVQPATITEKKEALFQRYRNDFDGHLSPTLRQALLENGDQNIYKTYEVTIFEGKRLVAFSYFDLGKQSVASIKGVYDPEYAKYSLGYYTMLLEIEYAKQQGFRFYYPGYVVPNYPKFDYKTRIGDVDYFDIYTRQWKPFSDFTEADIPIRVLHQQLHTLSTVLEENNIEYEPILYPLYESNMMGYWRSYYYEHPYAVRCMPLGDIKEDNTAVPMLLVATYDLHRQCFVLHQCESSKELTLYYEGDSVPATKDGYTIYFDLLIKRQKIIETASSADIVHLLKKVYRTF